MPPRTPRPKVLFGGQDAERAWNPGGPSVLPELGADLSGALLASTDELLVLLAGAGDEVLCSRRPPTALLRRLHAFGCAAKVTAVPGDPGTAVERRLAAGALPPGYARGRAALPYAVVPGTADAVRVLGATGQTVSAVVAARVNSKSWSNDFCRDHELEGVATVVRTGAQLDAAAAAIDGPVVLKSPHGVAGRGALLVRDRRQLAVVARRLDRQAPSGAQPLLVQPCYRRALDFSAHLDVRPGGSVLAGFRGMTNRGLAFSSSDTLASADRRRLEDDETYRAVLGTLGRALVAAGYHGPVSVDGLVTEDGVLVPVLDINARLSMGRYGLALERLCADRCRMVSLHTVPLRTNVSYEEADALVDQALGRAELRWDGSGPGVTALTAGTLQPPAGRLYFAVHADTAQQTDAVVRTVRNLLADGLPTPDGVAA
ncbi:hypothetical protein AB0E81_37640 [Streptomyces sp. NPDC033538]|uniref:hypothetical protein n=1 Tax=Streptomyces sp. NPDC033538 TaxID=3155367 RepID=UPI0033D6C8D7